MMNDKEKETVSAMIRIYCRLKHRQQDKLCYYCRQLEIYAHERLERCPYKGNKPVCRKCPIHCYKPEFKKKIKEVMRFSGARMIFYYPLDMIRHLWQK